jgi:purine-cytosine permease-like protein
MRYGLFTALIAIVLGNLFLLAIGFVSARLSVSNRCSTPEQAQRFFGLKGVSLFAAVLMCTKLGWFAIQLNIMSESVRETLLVAGGVGVPIPLLNIGFGVLIVGLAVFGLRAITKLSAISLPLMVGTLGIALYMGIKSSSFTLVLQGNGVGVEAISVAIAAAITAVLDMPTYFRLAKTPKDAYIAVVLLFLVCLPVIETVGVLLASFHPEKNLVTTLLGTSLLWNGWVTFFLIIAAWTTNNTNLYSANICCGVLVKQLSEKKRILLLGAGGISLSLLPLLNSFPFVLQIMGVGISAFGAVIYTSHFFEISWRSGVVPLCGWGIAALTGWMSLAGIIKITSMPLCDSFVLGIIMTGLLAQLQRRVTV